MSFKIIDLSPLVGFGAASVDISIPLEHPFIKIYDKLTNISGTLIIGLISWRNSLIKVAVDCGETQHPTNEFFYMEPE